MASKSKAGEFKSCILRDDRADRPLQIELTISANTQEAAERLTARFAEVVRGEDEAEGRAERAAPEYQPAPKGRRRSR